MLCLAAALIFCGAAFAQRSQQIWKEAEIFTDSKGVRYSDRVLVNFSENVIGLPKGIAEANRSDINPAFSTIEAYFADLERKYGKFRLIKRHPNHVWGDIFRVARGTNKVVAVPDFSQVFNLLFSKPVPIDSILTDLRRLRFVKYAEEPVWIYLAATPNDALYSQQWNLPKILADKAWDITQGSATIEIAINDLFSISATENHEDLQNKQSSSGEMWKGDHGRQVASVAAAATNNSLGMASLGWNLKFQTWGQLEFYDVTLAVDNGASVINMSWITFPFNAYLREYIAYALLQNVPCVAAAGNYFPTPPYVSYPAAYWFAADTGQVIAVSATNNSDNFVDVWNYSPGTNPINDPVNSFIDVAAPGYDVLTAHYNPNITNDYITDSGTSFSAPHVSALCGLILSINPTLTVKQVYDIITSSANKVGQYAYNSIGWNRYMGYGRIDAYQALLLVHAYANKSVSVNATAGNNGRRVVRDNNGKYHLTFESGTTSGKQEIFYRNSTDGINWSTPKRLSNGLSDGTKTSPSIYTRDNNIYVVWQKNTGSSYDITVHKSTDYGATWPTSNRKVPATNVGANPPLPVIVSPATNQLMIVYRTATNLSYQTSTDNGNTWSPVTPVPTSGTPARTPALAITTTYSGYARTALVNANSSNGTIYYRYYKSGDSTGWAALLKDLSIIVPGSYTGHQKPSFAPSGTAGNTRLHVAWEAASTSNGERVVIHRKATDWGTWPSVYSVLSFILNQPQLPSITGLVNDSAELLFQGFDLNNIYKRHYDGSTWGGAVFLAAGTNPSVSIGNTTAKYVWTSGSAAPYQIQTSTETLSKTQTGADMAGQAGGKQLATAYHRSIAVIDTTTGNWLEVRLDKLAVKTKSGEEFAVPFAEAKEDANSLAPANAFANLASSWSTLPADVESLFVRCQVNGQGLSAIKSRANLINVEIALAKKNGASLRLPVITTSSESLPATVRTIAIAASNLAGGEISLRAQVFGIENKSSLIASLGHIYEVVEAPLAKELSTVTENGTPQNYALSAYPNPFNPSTQIRFTMREAGLATLRVYNLNGQLVRELLHEHRAAGEHAVPWDGHDNRGMAAASGVYFIRFEAGNEVKQSKVMLVR